MLTSLIRSFPWTAGLSPNELGHVEGSLHERTFARGSYVCRTHERPQFWYGVLSGMLKASGVSYEGKPLSLLGIASGGWFGEGTLLKRELRKYDIVALRDSEVALMPTESFFWLVENSRGFNRWMLDQLNERLGQVLTLLADDRVLDGVARIARAIGSMFNPQLYPGMSRQIPITQEEIAQLAGASRQRTNSALRQLEAAGYIRVGYGYLTVVDIDGLRNFGADAGQRIGTAAQFGRQGCERASA